MKDKAAQKNKRRHPERSRGIQLKGLLNTLDPSTPASPSLRMTAIVFGAILGSAFNIFDGVEMSYASHILALIGLMGLNALCCHLERSEGSHTKGIIRSFTSLKMPYLFGLAFHTVSLFWVGQALTFAKYTVGVDLTAFAPLASFGMALILALQFPIAFKIGGPRFWIVPFLLLDIARSYSTTFFPWNFIGYAGTLWLSSFRLWTVFGSTALFLIFSQIQNYSKKGKIVLCLIAAVLIGDHYFYQQKTFQDLPYSVKIVQTNISLKDRSFAYDINTVARLSTKDPQTHLIVWPESAVLTCLHSAPSLCHDLSSLIPQGSHLVLGHVRVKNNARLFVTMSVLDDKGEIVASYNKQKLVPFGEYTPFFLRVPKLTYGKDPFTPGYAQDPLHVPTLGAVIPLICYETAFPQLVRKKANVIIGISNDAWYGKSSGPYQHFHLARCRAIEAKKPFIRSVNAGISGLIAPNGKVLAYIPFQKETVLIVDHLPSTHWGN